MALPGRGRKSPKNDQKNKLDGYFQAFKRPESKTNSASICREILSDIIENVCPEKLKRRHTGDKVTQKTFSEWKKKFPWLLLNETEMNMSCDICRKMKVSLKLTNVWASQGTNNIQVSSITRHNDSLEHKHACQQRLIETDKEKYEGETEINISVKDVSSDDCILFNTVYYAAKSDLPSSKVNELLDLQRQNGLSILYKNISWDTVSDIQQSICNILTTSVVEDINSSPVFGIMLDESTDITIDKRLSVCVRYINKQGEDITTFLSNTHLDDGCAHTVVNCVVSQFEKHGITLSKCTSLATDGAAVMMGKHTGVGKQMQAKYSPFCVQTHCVAHRLNLACVDSFKKNEYLLKFKDKFTSLYLFMTGSSKRAFALKQIQKLLEEPQLVVKEPHSIRWLGLKTAVEAVYECYSSILSVLSKFAEEKNPSAKGLFKYFSNYKVVLTVAFMLDVHAELAVLSTQLQKQDILFSEIQPLLEGTVVKLQSMECTDGRALADVRLKITKDESEEGNSVKYCAEDITFKKTMDKEFENMKKEYLKKLCKNIRDRFRKEDMQMFTDFSKVLEPFTVCSTEDAESSDAMEHLAEFYGTQKRVCIVEGNLIEGTQENIRTVGPLLDKAKLEEEWPRLHAMIKGAYSKMNIRQLCKRIISLHPSLLPNCAILASIGLCMAVASVECERSFSAQNRLKSKFRSSLNSASMDTLLKIKMLGPSVGSYDCSEAVRHWLKRKKRRRARLTSEYKPRPPKVRKESVSMASVSDCVEPGVSC